MAFTKEQKTDLVNKYETWLKDSSAFFLVEFDKMNMAEINKLRAKARDEDSQVHVAKNTLLSIALNNAGMLLDEQLVKTTLVGFTKDNAPGLAKVLNDAAKTELFEFKMGYLDGSMISVDNIKALADLPPLPVVRAQFLGLLNTPATKFVRTLVEPARQMAAVVKAFSEKEPAPAEG